MLAMKGSRMMLRLLSRGVALLLLLAVMSFKADPAAAAQLPRLEADALGGSHVVLPTDAAGKPLVLLLAFTKESEADLKSWSRKFLKDRVAQNAVVYVVVVAAKTAFVSRGHIRKLIEASAVGSEEQIQQNVLVTFTGDGWLTLVPPGDKRFAGVVVCDPSGEVVYAKREGYNAANLAEVERAAR
jgi:hypothetical protein